MIRKVDFNKTIIAVSCVLMLMAFYVLNCIYPLIHDDYAYCFVFDQNSDVIRPTSERITSLKDVFFSQWNHYLYVNGRFSAHVLIQIFAGLIGKSFFNVANVIVLLIFSLAFSKLVTSRYFSIFTFILFVIVLLGLPFSGQTIYWLSGGINYFWGTAFSLSLLVHIIYGKDKRSGIYSFLWCVIALFIGCFNESISIPVAGGLLSFLVFNHKNISIDNKLVIIAYCIGCALIILAPGTFTRIEKSEEIEASFNVLSFVLLRTWNLVYFFVTHPIPIVLLTAVFIMLGIRRKSDILKKESLFLYMLVIATVFLWLLNMWEERIVFFYYVILWILFFRVLCYVSFFKEKCFPYVLIVSIMFSIYGICAAYNSISSYNEYNNNLISQIKKSSSNCILPEASYNGIIDSNIYYNRLSSNPLAYHNRVMSFYYHKNFISVLPEEVYRVINSGFDAAEKINDFVSRLNVDNKYLLYICDKQVGCSNFIVKFKNPEYNMLSERQIIVRKLLGIYKNDEYIVETYNMSPIFVDGKFVFLIPYKGYEVVSVDSSLI